MFRNVSLTTKLAAAGAALILPLLWVTYLLSSEMSIRYDFGNREIDGGRYLAPLHELLFHAGEFRYLNVLKQNAQDSAAAIESDLAKVAAFQTSLGPALKSTEPFNALNSAWHTAQGSQGADADSAFISAVRELISRVGDTSNLILDPDLDTYYVMDTLLLKLPNSLDLLWQIREFGAGLMRQQQINPNDYTRMVVLTGLLQSDIDGIVYDTQVAYENNTAKDLPGAFQDAVDQYSTSTNALLQFLKNRVKVDSLQSDPAAFSKLAADALEHNLVLYREASPALETMLQRRIDGFAHDKYVLLTAVGVLALSAVLMSLLMFRQILRELGGEPAYAAAIVRTIAQGDLTARIQLKPDDATSLLASISLMAKELRKLIAQVQESANQILAYSARITRESDDIVSRSQQQSLATTTMSAAVQEVAASLHQMVVNSEQARNQATESSHQAQEGEAVVRDIITDMQNLCSFVERSAQSVEGLGQQSEQIYSIVSVIKSIAEQTNLLALNAAIEAARAGEQGRGFAVVADEVRNLAARTSHSTVEITEMIERIRNDTRSVVNDMAQGVDNANRSTGKINSAIDAMSQINQLSTDVNRSIQEISIALEQQAKANELLSENVESINQMSEQNSENVQNSAGSLQHLNNLAAELESAVSLFRLSNGDNGAKGKR